MRERGGRRPYTNAEILELLAADFDGLYTRRIGVWTLRKLGILLLYFQAFTLASGRAEGGYYVDGMAGPGLCQIKGAKAPPYYVWGSPLLALRTAPGFARCVFLEKAPSRVRALAERARAYGDRASVHEGDVNVSLADIIAREVPGWGPCFCLLDPEGTELHWATVATVAEIPKRKRKPELLILLPLRMGLLRLLTIEEPISPRSITQLDRVFPNEQWRDVFEQRLAETISPAEAKQQYVRLYCDGLRALRYRFVDAAAITAPGVAGGRRQERYHLIFASDHPAGARIMKGVLGRPFGLDYPVTQQQTLF